MIPAAYVWLDELPVTPNGKVDRRALPPPQFRSDAEGYVAPGSPAEQTLAGIWSEVLDATSPGLHDNFFYLGGHSLAAARVISRVRQAFGVDVPLRALFDHPTLSELAAHIETYAPAEAREPIRPRPRGGLCPLSFAQERLWFLDQLSPGAPLYNMPCSLRIDGAIDIAAIEASVNEIVIRHEALRTTFTVVDGRPVQVIAPSLRIPLRIIDLTAVDDRERHTEAMAVGTAETRRPFDLQRGPLIRAAVLRLSSKEHVLLITMHHIVSDGWSVGVLLQELQASYEARSHGRAPDLAELPIQYGDYAVWQREWLQAGVLQEQLAYWREQLAGAPAVLDLPTDRPRPPRRRSRGAYETFALSPALSAALRQFGEHCGATLFMMVLAAWQLVLSRWSGQDDVCVGTPVAGRHRPETEDLIGFFLNNLVMRTRLDGDPSFEDLLGRIREVAFGAFSHQDLPFEKRSPNSRPCAIEHAAVQAFLNVLTFAERAHAAPTAVAESALGGGQAHVDHADNNAMRAARGPRARHLFSPVHLTLYAENRRRRGGTLCPRLRHGPVRRRADEARCFGSSRRSSARQWTVPTKAVGVLLTSVQSQPNGFCLTLADRSTTWRGRVVGPDYLHRTCRTPSRLHRHRRRRGTGHVSRTRQAEWPARPRARSRGSAAATSLCVCGRGCKLAVGTRHPEVRARRSRCSIRNTPLRADGRARARPAACNGADRGRWWSADRAGGRPRGCRRGHPDQPAVVRRRARSARQLRRSRIRGRGQTSSPRRRAWESPLDPAGTPKGIVGRRQGLAHPFLSRGSPHASTSDPDDRFSMLSGLSHDPLQREVFTPLGPRRHNRHPAASHLCRAPDVWRPGLWRATHARRWPISRLHLASSFSRAAEETRPEPRWSTLRRGFLSSAMSCVWCDRGAGRGWPAR